MIKKSILIMSILITIILIAFICYLLLTNSISYAKNKAAVIEYVRTTYDISVEYRKGLKGESPWNKTRVDEFVFYDKDHEFYFNVFCSDEKISDCYQDAYRGNNISSCAKEFFSNRSHDFLIETVMYKQEAKGNNYCNAYCNLIIFSDSGQIEKNETFDILSFLIESYPKINITVRISDVKYKKDYLKILNYEQDTSLDSIPYIYRGNLSNITSIQQSQFQNLLSEWAF